MEKLIVPVSVVLSLMALSAIAAWYVVPASDKHPREAALVPLILPHTFRHVGLWFLIPGVTAPSIDPGFTGPAAWGDFTSAGLAWLAVIALRSQWSASSVFVWVFSIVGILDLLDAMFQGNLRLGSPGELGATFLIPTLVVPLLLVSHALVVRRMLKG
jgi:hypothetical protein